VSGLEGRTAIVTGASSGIGAATARALEDAGAVVVGGARRVDEVQASVAHPLDVRDRASCELFVRRAVEEVGAIDILVNNAGLALGLEPFSASTQEDEETVLETNVNGLIRMTRLVLPHFREGVGHIVNMGSVAAIWPYAKGTLYCTSKAAVHAFSRALREDLHGQPVRVTTIAPGLVETPFSSVRFRGDEERARAAYTGVGLGGPLRPEDIADCVVFAVSRPQHVNVDELVVMALAQSSATRVVRE
jgi:3-hydroxy acid dehydrogenase/malonic semialdehyde reductase